MRILRCSSSAVLIAAALLVSAASAAQTDFNAFEEDHYGTTVEFDGITFFDAELDWGPIETFAIDDATTHWPKYPDCLPYVDGKVLAINGFGVGPDSYLYCAARYFKMTTGQIESYGAISLVYLVQDAELDFTDNTVTLEAWLDGDLVASDSTYLDHVVGYPPRHSFGASRLEVSEVDFDTLRIVSDGPENGGMMLGAFDNVVITPEPGALGLLALGAIAIVRRR
jgi:hypothetical protein